METGDRRAEEMLLGVGVRGDGRDQCSSLAWALGNSFSLQNPH